MSSVMDPELVCHAADISYYPDKGLYRVELTDLESLDYQGAIQAIQAAHDRIRQEGTLTLRLFNFGRWVEKYRLDRVTSQELWNLLMLPARKSWWDDTTIATMLLRSGFYKVHTEDIAGDPFGLLAVGLRFVPPPDY